MSYTRVWSADGNPGFARLELPPGIIGAARDSVGGGSRYNGWMQIILNGAPRDCVATTVAQLLDEAGYGGRRVAVELNQEIVPRSQHGNQPLAAGDRIEIVHAIGGG